MFYQPQTCMFQHSLANASLLFFRNLSIDIYILALSCLCIVKHLQCSVACVSINIFHFHQLDHRHICFFCQLFKKINENILFINHRDLLFSSQFPIQLLNILFSQPQTSNVLHSPTSTTDNHLFSQPQTSIVEPSFTCTIKIFFILAIDIYILVFTHYYNHILALCFVYICVEQPPMFKRRAYKAQKSQ